jgi:renalase
MAGTRNGAGTGPRIAVVGAGIAGLCCARALRGRGARVSIFEREVAPGGRLGVALGEAGNFDAGAQYLVPRSPEFARELRSWVEADVVRTWEARLVRLGEGGMYALPQAGIRLVGVPDMRAIAGWLARDLDLTCHAEVAHLARTAGGWLLLDGGNLPLGTSAFDAVVLAVPSPVAAGLARGTGAQLGRLAGASWNACWVASILLTRPSGIDFDGAFIEDDPILSWAAREDTKPGRGLPAGISERWVLQARSSWSNGFGRLPPVEAGRWMQRAFAARLQIPLAQKSCCATRWQLAMPETCLPETHLWDGEERLGFAGDWLGAPHIEGAWRSGIELARAILGGPQ